MTSPRGAASANRIASRHTSTTHPRTRGERTKTLQLRFDAGTTLIELPQCRGPSVGYKTIAGDRGEIIE